MTLLVDKGVTLFGSRDAAMYESDARPRASRGCAGRWRRERRRGFPAPSGRRRFAGLQAVDLGDECEGCGIMGDGVIDGRGYAKIMGKDYSWWEMAREAEPKNERYFSLG